MADLHEMLALDEPPLPGQSRVLFCRLCGAITYLWFGGNPEGLGDPAAHNRYHAERGEALPEAR